MYWCLRHATLSGRTHQAGGTTRTSHISRPASAPQPTRRSFSTAPAARGTPYGTYPERLAELHASTAQWSGGRGYARTRPLASPDADALKRYGKFVADSMISALL